MVNSQLVAEFLLIGNGQISTHFPICEQIFTDVTSMLSQIRSLIPVPLPGYHEFSKYKLPSKQ
jgi:hypothetical protein